MKQDFCQLLQSNPYPGRGILLGRTPDGKKAVLTYFIMGRSENSRNRIFEATADGIRTKAFDESKMVDPSLIIYSPVRVHGKVTIVTNGDQTDTIYDALADDHCYRHALKTRTFEPDVPNFTPRISGVITPAGTYNLSILKTMDNDDSTCQRFFYEYDAPKAGVGHFISTYQGDGTPLPSFHGEPIAVEVDCNEPQPWANKVWVALNEDNKVSLFVRFLDLETLETEDVIVNKHQ